MGPILRPQAFYLRGCFGGVPSVLFALSGNLTAGSLSDLFLRRRRPGAGDVGQRAKVVCIYFFATLLLLLGFADEVIITYNASRCYLFCVKGLEGNK